MKRQKFNITGMHCTNCSLNITKNIEKKDGIENVNINLITSKMSVIYDENKVDNDMIIETVKKLGFGIEVEENINTQNIEKKEKNYDIYKLVISIFFSLIIMYISMGHMLGFKPVKFSTILQILISSFIMIFYYKYYISGIRSLLNKNSNMLTLISVSTLSAYIYSIISVLTKKNDIYFESIVVILTLVSIGKFVESKIKKNASDTIYKMMDLTPKKAVIIKGGKEILIEVEELEVGDEVLVKSGEIIACDGSVIEGKGYVNESSITGESKLIEKNINDQVISSSILEKGYIIIKVEKENKDTVISKIINLVEEATSSKPPISKLADKISGILVPIIFCIAILTLILSILFGVKLSDAINRSISVLVISCPCALGIATPISIMVGSLKGAKMGILFKSAELLEIIKDSTVILFDKTGTLTKGKPKVIDFINLTENNEIYDYIYSIEKKSEHHLANSIVNFFNDKNYLNLDIEEFIQHEGRGISSKINGKKILIGNVKMMRENNVELDDYLVDIKNYSNEGKTIILVSIDYKLSSLITIADEIRDDAKLTIEKIKSLGIRPIMLTGDNEGTAKYVGKNVGIDEIYYGLLPNEKYKILLNLQKNNKVIMVGDGINDAPALAKSDVGISIGGSTDIAMEISDIVLIRQKLIDIVNAIYLSISVIKNIKISLFWAFIYNFIGVAMATGIFSKYGINLNPMFAAFAMSMSSICVLLNAMTLNFFKGVK
ncbi:heavy metal translocating P-type ATPase [Streptobacillus felis]|uniref:Copper-translocating P-type ATPase n=2 Tax=Streptobacillus TaxID=34104 RepID=A0A7Z0PES2_9FUSO|nr:heavy metal translocating P-type ATPase [Streptobacillus felis]NYV27408.1 copper-translocating P-type ATPase [Streptobacillus felis]